MDQNEKKLCLSRFTVQNDISRRFFHFFKILIFRVVREVKGQKLVQNFKKFCLSRLSLEPYIIWLFMLHKCKVKISPVVFLIFPKFLFLCC